MGLLEEEKKKLGRKLTRRRRDQRPTTIQFPERLEEGDDTQEDVTASKGQVTQYMNQSVFSMIAAAGSRTDFHAPFDADSSESEEEEEIKQASSHANPSSDLALRESLDGQSSSSVKRRTSAKEGRQKPEHKHSRLPKLHLRTIKEKNYMSQSMLLPPREPPSDRESPKGVDPRDAPMMSQILKAESQRMPSPTPMDPQATLSEEPETAIDIKSPTSLKLRLMEIFGFEEPEEVVSEYPCWLLQSVLLQGYMYITAQHICFYAYLPKKSNVIAKSGYLAKRGKQNHKYSRYWFTLKGDVLSYYADPSDRYFPAGNIDLRYGISATVTESKDKKDALHFTVVTHHRTYYFKADSAASAKEWVKTLQKVIFRSHNDGDSVKISLPIENVIDIEESPVIDFAETFRIRVVDSEETYAIDEYFFSFFSFGKDALDVLRAMVDETLAQKIPKGYLSLSPGHESGNNSRDRSRNTSQSPQLHGQSPLDSATPVLRESVRATLSPLLLPVSGRVSPRMSGEWPRSSSTTDMPRRSMDVERNIGRASFESRGRRSVSTSRMNSTRKTTENRSPESKDPGSSDSYVQSFERATESSLPANSSDDTQASASQILNRSDVFQSPTINRRQTDPEFTEDERPRLSRNSTNDVIKVQPGSRSQTEGSLKHAYYPLHAGRHTQELDDSQQDALPESSSTRTLQQLVKAGSYPLQRASGFASYLKNRSKKMSSLLATESMGYVEKVSGMWAGGRRHYGDSEGVTPQNAIDEPEEDEDKEGYEERFRAHFALPTDEKLQATYFGYLRRVLPLYGKIYISNRRFCFRSLLPGTRTKLILPLKDIETVDKEKGFRFGYSGLVIVIRAFEEIFFEFRQVELRDDCAVTLLRGLESVKYLQESGLLSQEDRAEAETAKAEHRALQEARNDGYNEHELKMPKFVNEDSTQSSVPPILFDDPRASIINFKPTESLRITCLTIGSRGDVQPYIALCKGLIADGHKPRIATHAEFGPWVKSHGIGFSPVDGDPAELMRICVENGMFTYSFLKEASAKFRGWIDELLSSAWKACQDSDILIESPSAMAGIHIAEALEIPYFRAFTMPWTRTRAYPHAFAVPEHKMGGAYNYMTYVMFDNVFWTAIAGQVNRWRKKELGLRSTSLDKLHPNKVPFLYNFSPSVVVPPLDYSDWIRVTGYWFLDEAAVWSPPKELTDFIARARKDGKKIVYIGFGSIVVSDPAALTKTVVESVLKADVRCILSKGWSDRLGNKDATEPEILLPPEIHQIKSAPHDWLFRQIDAATHHGGAGTTGASLRAGLPTIIKPFFGDQFFFGSRVEDLGVGICMKKLNVSVFSRALWEATHSERMIVKARVLGEQIRKEDGVATAIQAIYRDLEYAKTLIKNRTTVHPDNDLGDEESWTFIGDDKDPELVRRIAEWDISEAVKKRESMTLERASEKASEKESKTGGVGAALGMKFLRRPSKETVPII